ncbi:diguanylate cyclase (GGDEF)-like protein/PAS domain S-box-containing protein [Oikeobacillus pervagus]|uniref:Diguanylate cyclase (GGDEF)-like protein/PAS domain S-box-containing protein n=1 Tax=Oikeobacillus pervagus TaxID=1325931 RepID=A0AAJ1T0I5_9BACI|nr:sensor domain-containing diguanylate cyclase [Oikeobacillus pervagus]MDQ0214481.1 diguanylate cyclase (GGDEF)-like protein/PAS domain S-box-containing protein [Oikeobacillus pervagus]
MWILFFFLGLMTGISIWAIYANFIKSRWNTKLEEIIYRLVEESKDVIYHYEVRPECKFTYISPSLEKFLGKGVIKESLENSDTPLKRIHPDDYRNLSKKVRGELDFSHPIIQRWKDNEGIYRWFEEYATPIYRNGQFVAVQGIIRNIDEKVKLQKELEYRIYHDALTGIYNREYFELISAKFNEQTNSSVAIILCDLDELKYTNDHFGHKKGDELIIAAAGLLNKFNCKEVSVSRIGGDEFVLLATGKAEKEIDQLVNGIVKEMDEYSNQNNNLMIKMSVGFAYSPTSIGLLPKLFAQADQNMYKNKASRKEMN